MKRTCHYRVFEDAPRSWKGTDYANDDFQELVLDAMMEHAHGRMRQSEIVDEMIAAMGGKHQTVAGKVSGALLALRELELVKLYAKKSYGTYWEVVQ